MNTKRIYDLVKIIDKANRLIVKELNKDVQKKKKLKFNFIMDNGPKRAPPTGEACYNKICKYWGADQCTFKGGVTLCSDRIKNPLRPRQ